MIFRHSLKTWRTTWCIGLFLSILALLFNKHLFYIYYYFFFVGSISLLNYFNKYVCLDSHGLTLYYNALSHVSIQWNDIKSAIKSTYEKDNIKTAGGRVRFTINQKETSEAILLEFFKPINKEINNSNVQISDNGHKLRILAPPDGGLGNLLVSINEYLNKEPKNLSRHGKNKILTVINIAIFMLSITFILINISKFILN